MKNTFIIICLILFSKSFCQTSEITETAKSKPENQTSKPTEAGKKSIFEKKNELKIGGIHLLAGQFNATYEYLHSKEFTYGSSILIGPSNALESFSITPFARFYFQETKEYGAHGFFVEGFAKYLKGESGIYLDSNKPFSATAFGISIGKKWVNMKGFVVETLFGAGRVISGTTNRPDIVLRGDLFIGYRF